MKIRHLRARPRSELVAPKSYRPLSEIPKTIPEIKKHTRLDIAWSDLSARDRAKLAQAAIDGDAEAARIVSALMFEEHKLRQVKAEAAFAAAVASIEPERLAKAKRLPTGKCRGADYLHRVKAGALPMGHSIVGRI